MARRRKAEALEENETTSLADSFADNRKRLAGLAKVTGDAGDWRPAVEVLREVEAVPTCFSQVDAITKVGGWPISRVGVVFGPSGDGKTAFLIGLGASFLARGHFFGLLDAEHTTPPSWLRKLVGDEMLTHPGFAALAPSTYEKNVEQVRKFCERVKRARIDGDVPPDTTALIGIDSIRKLVPENLFKNLAREVAEGGKKLGKRMGVDGMNGRAAQYKAALNAAWMDELVPLLADTRCAVVIIAREDLDPEDLYVDRPKIGGGRALFYDSSLVVRVSKHDLIEELNGEKTLIGERHIATIYKTKIAGRDERKPMAAFHTSNGRIVPEGFWPARDVLELAEECGVVERRGSFYMFGKKRLGQGALGTLKRLFDEPTLFAELEAATRATLRPTASPPA